MKFGTLLKKTGYLLRKSFSEFIDDHGLQLSAALSYYTIFALPPLLILVTALSGFFFGADAVQGHLFGQISGLIGNEAALQMQEIMKNVTFSSEHKFATGIGFFFLVIGASGVFAEIQDAINHIWGIQAKPKRGFLKFLKNRVMSFTMIGSVGFLLLVGLVINSLMDVFSSRLAHYFSGGTFYLFYVLNVLLVFIIILILFTVIFKTLPDGNIRLRDGLVGASFTAFLFMVGKFSIGVYLGKLAISTVYGAAGSVILILIWVYYSAIILYFGAEFTKVYARTHGQKVMPNSYSVEILRHPVGS